MVFTMGTERLIPAQKICQVLDLGSRGSGQVSPDLCQLADSTGSSSLTPGDGGRRNRSGPIAIWLAPFKVAHGSHSPGQTQCLTFASHHPLLHSPAPAVSGSTSRLDVQDLVGRASVSPHSPLLPACLVHSASFLMVHLGCGTLFPVPRVGTDTRGHLCPEAPQT